jgi:hypothetical protein
MLHLKGLKFGMNKKSFEKIIYLASIDIVSCLFSV